MTECRVMIKTSTTEAKAKFQEYGDMAFSERGNRTLVEDFSGTQLFG